jgi:hypothetical protein
MDLCEIAETGIGKHRQQGMGELDSPEHRVPAGVRLFGVDVGDACESWQRGRGLGRLHRQQYGSARFDVSAKDTKALCVRYFGYDGQMGCRHFIRDQWFMTLVERDANVQPA